MEKYFKLSEFDTTDHVTLQHFINECNKDSKVSFKAKSELIGDSQQGIINIYGFTLNGIESDIDNVVNCVKSKILAMKANRGA